MDFRTCPWILCFFFGGGRAGICDEFSMGNARHEGRMMDFMDLMMMAVERARRRVTNMSQTQNEGF